MDLRGFRRRSGVAAGRQPNRQSRDGIAQPSEVDDGIRTLIGGEVIYSVSHMRLQGLASRSTKLTLRMFQQNNSLGTLRKILHTYGLPNRWEVGCEMTRGTTLTSSVEWAALAVGLGVDTPLATAGSPHADFFAVRSDRRPGDVRHHRLPDTFSYNDCWSMVGGIVIIAKTLRAVFQRDGAY
jgi:hypothetical protein